MAGYVLNRYGFSMMNKFIYGVRTIIGLTLMLLISVFLIFPLVIMAIITGFILPDEECKAIRKFADEISEKARNARI